jgi:hypothetical protein
VAPDGINKRTLIEWSEVLGGGSLAPPPQPKVYALRQRAALFGYNAVDPNLLTITPDNNLANRIDQTTDPTKWTWKLPIRRRRPVTSTSTRSIPKS